MKTLDIRICEYILTELTKTTLVHLYSRGFRNDGLAEFDLDLTKNLNLIYDSPNLKVKQELDSFFKETFDMNTLIKGWYNELVNDRKLIKFLKVVEDFGIVDIIDVPDKAIEKIVDMFGNVTYNSSTYGTLLYQNYEMLYIDLYEYSLV